MEVKEIRALSGLTQEKFAEQYGIPLGTLRKWEAGTRMPPPYLKTLLENAVRQDLHDK